MSDFGATINAYLQGRVVFMTPLVKLDFANGAQYFWLGEYPLTVGGNTYIGIGRLVSIEGLDQAAGIESAMMTLTLSGVVETGSETEILAIAAAANKANYVGRVATVYMQFFDTTMENAWAPLDTPFAIKAGLMSRMPISKVPTDTGWLITISLQVNNIFYGRGIAPGSTYSDRDQQLAFTGDKFLQFIAQLQSKQLKVPWR